MSHRTARPLVATAFALVAFSTIALAGCASAAAPIESPTYTAKPKAEKHTEQPVAPTEPAAANSELPTCAALLPASFLDTLASGFTEQNFTPAEGTWEAQVVSDGGIACKWVSTADDSLIVAVAQPSADQLSTAETAIGNEGTATTLFGSDIKAWVAKGGGTFPGTFNLFTPIGTWVTTTSSLYTDPQSTYAQSVVSYVLQALPS